MGDPSQLIYSLVARGTTVLAEHAEFQGNVGAIAVQCLVKLPEGSSRHTYVCDHHTFNFLIEGGFTYLAVAGEEFGRQVPFAFLERVRDDFQHRYPGGRADLAAGHSLDAEFSPRLQQHMAFVLANPDEAKRVSRIKGEVAEVKGIMMENITKVLDRHQKIDLLVDKTAGLQADALQYERQGNQIRRRFWWRHFRLKLLVLLLLIIVAFVIYLSICKGFVCHNR